MKKLFAILMILGLAIAILFPTPASAQVLFANPKDFTIAQTCNAVSSIRKGSAPVTLKVGEIYPALGKNTPQNANYIYLKVNGDRKWAAIECGTFENRTSVSQPIKKEREKAKPIRTVKPVRKAYKTTFLPFFDFQDNPVFLPRSGRADITPKPPQLDTFDLAVNQVCGQPGKGVSRQEFKDLMNAHPDVLTAVQTYTHGKVYRDRPTPARTAAYLEDLTDAWFNARGFEHIFCGEPIPGGKIGGLHYFGRYLDLQQKGLAGRLDRNQGREEVEAGVMYTIGVAMRVKGKLAISPMKGYGYTLSAKDLLEFVTQAFADNPTPSNRSTACVLTINDDRETFTSIFVRRSQGIRTFFPDSTPNYRDPLCF